MAENNFYLKLQGELDKVKSQVGITQDIKDIEKQIESLKIRAELDEKSVQNIIKQLNNVLNQKVTVGGNIGDDIYKSVEKSLQQTKKLIADAFKNLPKLNASDLISKFNLNGKDIDASVVTKVRELTKELNSLASEAVKTNSDSVWSGLIKNIVDLGDTLNQFGKVKVDISQYENVLKLADELKKSKIYVDPSIKNDVLAGANVSSLKELNNELISMGVSFTTASKGAKNLDSVWEEFINTTNRSDLSNITNSADKVTAVVNELRNAKKVLYGDKAYQSAEGYGTEEMLTWVNSIEQASKKMSVYQNEQAELEKQLAEVVVQSEKQKQDAIEQTQKTRQKQNSSNADKSALTEKQLLNFDARRAKILQEISTYLSRNSKLTASNTEEARTLQGKFEQIRQEVQAIGRGDNSGLSILSKQLSTAKLKVKELKLEGSSLSEEFGKLFKRFNSWLSVGQFSFAVTNKIREAITEIKDLDNILTEISKTSDLTASQLNELGDSAFETASKYGKSASDYLTGIQEMYRSGFDNAEQMAELSVLAQTAGDMSAEMANNYLIATNSAYKLKGNVEALNAVLDGQNYITNNAAVNMNDMGTATSKAASIAAQSGVKINELSALIATGVAQTKKSGDEVGTAIKSIFVNLQNTQSDKIVKTFDSVGISMTKIENGAERLKTPIELIKELAEVYNSLDEGSPLRANIVNNLAGKYQANVFSGILSGIDDYDRMIKLYSEGSGSAMIEAQKSAANLESALNRINNTITDIVDNVLGSQLLTDSANGLNDILGLVNQLTDKLGTLGTISVIGAGVIGVNKKSAFNLSNIISQYKDLSNTVTKYNTLTSNANFTSEKFNASLKNNNTMMGEYLKSLNGASASIGGYIKYLTTAKVSTVALSAATTALNMALSMGTAYLISAGITALSDFVHKAEEARAKSTELSNSWKDNNTSLNDTISQYKELNEKLKDSSLSTEEVKSVKEQLASIQDTLNQKYGDEVDSIDLVNGKYDEQIEKLDELSKKKSQDYVATNAGNIKEDKEYLSKVISGDNTTDIARYQTNLGNDEEEKQYKEAEKTYKKYLKKYEALSLGYDYFKGTTGLRLNVKGTREEIQTQLSQLFSELNEDYKDNPPEFIQGLKDVITETLNMDDFDTTKIENAKNNIKAYTEAEILANSKTRNLYNDSVKAVEEYNNALASGKGVKAAKENLDDVQQKVSEAIKGYEGYDNVFNEIFDSIQKADDKIKEVKSDVDSSDVDTTITFKAAFNAEDFADTKEKLLELAKAGELTPYTLSSTKEYNDLLQKTGLTAEQAYKKIMKIAHADMTDADWQATLTHARSQITNIQSALDELKENGESSTFIDTIISDYPQLLGYLGNEQEMRRQLIALQDEQKDSANLAYTNLIADSEVYYETLKTQEADKLTTINNTANAIISGNKYLVDVLGKNYKIDLNNYKSIADAKAKLETELIKNSASAWSKFYQVQVNASTGLAEVIGSSTTTPSEYMGSDGDYGKAVSKYTKEQNKQKKAAQATADAYNKVIASLNNVASATNITTGIGSGSGGGSSSKNTKTITKFSKTIDWCAETITNLTNKIGNLNAKLNNTDALKNQIKYYKQLINAQNGLVKGYEKTADRYQKVYNKALKKLSKSDQNKVKNGAYTIEQFSGKAKSGKKSGAEKRYNNIQKAIEARDNVVSNSNNLIDAKAQLKEYAEGLASIRWDKASEKVDKLSNSISVLDTKLSNASGYKAKSAILKEQLDLQKRSVTAQENAVKNTQNDANGYLKKISSKYKKNKNKDGTIKTTGVTDKAQLKLITVYNAYVRKLAEETVELSQAQENYKAAVNDSAISNSEFVQSDYDNKVSLLEATENRLNSEIELAETRGQVASADYYKSLTDNAEKIKKQREEEKALLEEQIKDVEPYTDTWYILKQAIFDVDQAIADETKNAVDNTNKQIKAMTELTSKMNSYISSATDALGWFDDLIESEDLYDDNGNLTNKAYASLKLKEGEVEGSKTRQSNYQKDLLELDRNYANGEMTQAQYLDAKLELEKNIRDEIKTQIDLRKEQNDIIKESYKEQKKALDEIIDKKKKALSLDKSEHDYRKSITEKTKNIADLQKQIAMLKGDTSEEAKAQRQKLEVELKDAQDDLDDTQWEKYIERYENAMDDLSDRLDVLIEKLDDLTSDGIKKVITTNDDKANEGIEEIAKENDIDTKVLGNTANDTLNGSSTFDNENEKAKEVYSSDTPTEQKQEDTTISNAGETIGRVILNGEIPDDIKKLLGDSDTSNSNYVEATGVPLLSKDVVNKVKKFINNKDNTEKAKKKKSEYGILNKEIYDITNGRILSKANRLKLAKMLNITDANKDGDVTGAEAKKVVELLKQIPGFSSGGIVEIAKRNGDDGLVTLKAGESVLTPVQTDALMQLGKNLVPLNNFMDIIQRPNIVPNFANGVNSSSTTTIDSINLNIPNVTDKESFIKMFKSEADVRRLFENSIDNRTIGGNRRLNANRL